MELRHLRYFAAVAAFENVRRAAETLHVAQPAVSRQLRDLESELEVALFDRVGRGLKLTRAGEAYLVKVRLILAEVDSAGQQAKRIARGDEGELRIGFIESASWTGVFPEVVQVFKRRRPGVQLVLHSLSSRGQLDALSKGELDVGFLYHFGAPPSDMKIGCVRRDAVSLALPINSPILNEKHLTLSKLGGEPFVWFPRSVAPAYFDQLLTACHAGGLSPRIVQEAETEATMLSLVSAGVGGAFVNEANANRAPARVAFRRVDDLTVSIELHCVHRARPDRILTGFLDVVRQSVSEHATAT